MLNLVDWSDHWSILFFFLCPSAIVPAVRQQASSTATSTSPWVPRQRTATTNHPMKKISWLRKEVTMMNTVTARMQTMRTTSHQWRRHLLGSVGEGSAPMISCKTVLVKPQRRVGGLCAGVQYCEDFVVVWWADRCRGDLVISMQSTMHCSLITPSSPHTARVWSPTRVSCRRGGAARCIGRHVVAWSSASGSHCTMSMNGYHYCSLPSCSVQSSNFDVRLCSLCLWALWVINTQADLPHYFNTVHVAGGRGDGLFL